MSDFLGDETFSLTAGEVEEIVRRGRSERFELIPSIPDESSDLAITAGAMANSGGGYITIGATKSEDIVGVTDPDIVDDIIYDEFFEYIEEPNDFTAKRTSCVVDSHNVVVIKVEEFGRIPVSVSGTFYTRAGTSERPLRPSRLADLILEASDS